MRELPEEVKNIIKGLDILGIKVYQINRPVIDEEIIYFEVRMKNCDYFKGNIGYSFGAFYDYDSADIARDLFAYVCMLMEDAITVKYDELVAWDTKRKLAFVAGIDPEDFDAATARPNRPKM